MLNFSSFSQKFLFSFALSASAFFGAVASPLSPQNALARATGFVKKIPCTSSSDSYNFSFQGFYQLKGTKAPAFYIYEYNNESYMLIGADTRVAPVLAVIPRPESLKDGIPPQMKWFVNGYLNEISVLYSGSQDSDDDSFTDIYSEIDASRKEVGPLLETKWNQDFPYNLHCPVYAGVNSVTGCVATAMAQVMAYYKWPEQGRGFFKYSEDEFDFENTRFNWTDMLPEYGNKESGDTEAQRLAVAELMHGAGVSVSMTYTPQMSGAFTMRMADALRNYFRYSSSTCYKVRDVYSRLEWEEMIYRELAEGRPVLYGGRGAAGGHSFVCDGYLSDGLFHFNWGWGGAYDGYFRISALDPAGLGIGGGSGQFNSDQDAIIGIVPDYDDADGMEPSPIFCSGGFTPGSNFSNKGDRYEVSFYIDQGAIINPSASKYKGNLGVLLSDGQSDPEWIPCFDTEFEPISDDGNMPPRTLFKGVLYYKDRKEGEYRIFPAFCREGGVPERIRCCVGKGQCVYLRIDKRGTARLIPDMELVLPDITVTRLTTLTDDSENLIDASIVCGDTGYEGDLYLTATCVEDNTEKTVAIAAFSGSPSSINDLQFPLDCQLPEGVYTLRVRDELWREFGAPLSFEVKPSGMEFVSPDASTEERYYTIDGLPVSDPSSHKGMLIRVKDGVSEVIALP